MAKVEYKGIILDSTEEKEFYMWCEEAVEHGVISGFIYQPPSFDLSAKKVYLGGNSKGKSVNRELLKKHIYTPDFILVGCDTLPLKKKYQNSNTVYIDVKGGFQKHRGGQEFSVNQKWVYDKFTIYVHKVVPEEFFKATWVPEEAKWTPKRTKIQKKYIGVWNARDYLRKQGGMAL